MNDTLALITAMEQLDLQRDAAKASNELTLSMAKSRKAKDFIDFYKMVCPQGDAQKLLGINDSMSLDDFITAYKKLCDM